MFLPPCSSPVSFWLLLQFENDNLNTVNNCDFVRRNRNLVPSVSLEFIFQGFWYVSCSSLQDGLNYYIQCVANIYIYNKRKISTSLIIDKFLDIKFEDENNLNFSWREVCFFFKRTFSSLSVFFFLFLFFTVFCYIYDVLYDNNCVSSNNNIAYNLDSHSSS